MIENISLARYCASVNWNLLWILWFESFQWISRSGTKLIWNIVNKSERKKKVLSSNLKQIESSWGSHQKVWDCSKSVGNLLVRFGKTLSRPPQSNVPLSFCFSPLFYIFFPSDQDDFPARKPRASSADVPEHGASCGKTSHPSSETKQHNPAPIISIPLPPECHDTSIKTQQLSSVSSSGTPALEVPALQNKSATKNMPGFYTWHQSANHHLGNVKMN